jgi:hypothetical protein
MCVLNENDMFKFQITLYRHGLRPIRKVCHLLVLNPLRSHCFLPLKHVQDVLVSGSNISGGFCDGMSGSNPLTPPPTTAASTSCKSGAGASFPTPEVPPILTEAFNRYYKNGFVYRCLQCAYECNLRQMVAGDGHAHQRSAHSWDYAQDQDKFSGFAAVPTAVMVGAYAQQATPSAAVQVGVLPDWSCSPDSVAQFSRGLDCRVMPGTAVTVAPPAPAAAGTSGGWLTAGCSGRASRSADGRSYPRSVDSAAGSWLRRLEKVGLFFIVFLLLTVFTNMGGG